VRLKTKGPVPNRITWKPCIWVTLWNCIRSGKVALGSREVERKEGNLCMNLPRFQRACRVQMCPSVGDLKSQMSSDSIWGHSKRLSRLP
jgi:hypothetical protein